MTSAMQSASRFLAAVDGSCRFLDNTLHLEAVSRLVQGAVCLYGMAVWSREMAAFAVSR